MSCTESLLFSLDGRMQLAESVLERANSWQVENKTTIGKFRFQEFSDNERCIDFTDSVRGKRVYLLTSPNTPERILDLLLAIDAAKRADAEKIIPLIPSFPYARSDKKDQTRGPIGGKLMAKMIEAAGSTGIVTFDLHADQIEGFFDIPLTHVEGQHVFCDTLREMIGDDVESTVFCGPDAGSGKRMKRTRDQLQRKHGIYLPIVMIDKDREEANKVKAMELIGEVAGKHVILVDDILDTGGTLVKGCDLLLSKGALSVRAVISHPVMSGLAYDNIFNSNIKELVVSDSLPTKTVYMNKLSETLSLQESINDKMKIISIAQQFGMAIAAINNNTSFELLKENERSRNRLLSMNA